MRCSKKIPIVPILATLSLILALTLSLGCKPREDKPAGGGEWVKLFNGKDLQGWKKIGKGRWNVENGELVGRWDPDDPGGGFLITTSDYSDFRLKLEFWIGKNGNSGVVIRDVSHGGEVESPSRYGYEVQIYNNPRGDMTTGSIYSLARAPAGLAQDNRWNSLEILAVGDHLTSWVNGKKAAELFSRRSFKGSIDLQIHDRESPTKFRNIQIQVLPRKEDFWPTIEDRLTYYRGQEKRLLKDKSLEGWKKSGRTSWSVSRKTLAGVGGPGTITIPGTYGNFHLRLEYRLKPGAECAVIVRSPERGKGNKGYRIILNDTDDPAVPEPSGSIHGLARGLAGLGRSGWWNRLDIYAFRNQIAVHVNGKKACDLTDGKFSSGKIGLVAEEPKGWLAIRNLVIKPYPDI